jgi:tetratricopeptide (TPR) repeat protein
VRSDATGKALGTALQAAIAAGRRDATWYDQARALSELALRQFERDSDRSRQAGYRAQLETDAGDLEAALAWLHQCTGAPQQSGVGAVVRAAYESKSWFALMHVVRLLEACARARARGEEVAWNDELQEAWRALRLEERDELRNPTEHPLPVIVWKWGSALCYQGHFDAAKPLLDKAIKSLESQAENITLQLLALGVRCDRLALLVLSEGPRSSLYRDNLRTLRDRLCKLSEAPQPSSQRAYLEPWTERINQLDQEHAPSTIAALWRALAWDVAY